MEAHIMGHGGAGTMEVKASGQFIGEQGEVEGLAVGQDVMEVSDCLGGPEACGGIRRKVWGGRLVCRPASDGGGDRVGLG
jgi:hypothetical protein